MERTTPRPATRERMKNRMAKVAQLRTDIVAADSDGDYETANDLREELRKTVREHTLVK
ncbi:MAG: hypothetical protein KAY24_11960 [Candidatus Eisenbacteria sp.]|nr:hypothetical protein [Candidatus Eisenbacteria bacterium]